MKVVGLAGWSGAGKTTLIERIIPVFARRGLSVSTLKHAHHKFDMDVSGKDSWRHREAGAREVLVAAAGRWALLHELRDEPEPQLPELLSKLSPVDLVLLEGWRSGKHPKIEVWRQSNGKPPLFVEDQSIKGLAGDVRHSLEVDFAHIDDLEQIADLLLKSAIDVADLAA